MPEKDFNVYTNAIKILQKVFEKVFENIETEIPRKNREMNIQKLFAYVCFKIYEILVALVYTTKITYFYKKR